GECVNCCRENRRGKPQPNGCSPLMGCDNLTDPTDKQLCKGLLNCLYAHPSCWMDSGSVSDCYCGTAQATDCSVSPNGVCVAEVLAAAKVPANDFANGSIRFFNTAFPSGHASQEPVCDLKCLNSGTCASLDAPLTGTCGSDTGGTGGGGTGG